MPEFDLDDAFNEYYKNQSLSDEKTKRILKSPRPPIAWMPLTAACLFLSLIFFLWPQATLNQKVAQQILDSHFKQEKLTVKSTQLKEINKALPLKNLKLAQLPPEIRKNHIIIGGRYCKVHTQKALQIRIQNKSTKEITSLFVTGNQTLGPFNKTITQFPSKKSSVKIWIQSEKVWGWVQSQ